MKQNPSLHDIVDSLEEGDEFKVHAGEFIVDEINDMEARPIIYVRKKSVGGYMAQQYRLEWADPTDKSDETLVIRTKYKSHWSEWATFDPERVELPDEDIYVHDHTTDSCAKQGFITLDDAKTWAVEHGPEYEPVDARPLI